MIHQFAAFALVATLSASSSLNEAFPEAARVLRVADAVGDLRTVTDSGLDGPSHADIAAVSVWVDSLGLVLAIDTARTLPDPSSPEAAATEFGMYIDTDENEEPDYYVGIAARTPFDSSQPATWRGRMNDVDGMRLIPLGPAQVSDRSLAIPVPLPPHMVDGSRIRIETLVIDSPDASGGMLEGVAWEDRLPEDFGWLSLSDARGGGPAPLDIAPFSVPSLHSRDVSVELAAQSAEGELDGVRLALLEMLSTRPTTTELIEDTLGVTDIIFTLCEEELAPTFGAFQSDVPLDESLLWNSACAMSFGVLYLAYAHDGGDEWADVISEFVGVTTSRLARPARENYLKALRATPGLLETSLSSSFQTGG